MNEHQESGVLQSLNQGIEVLKLLAMHGSMRNKDLAEKTGLSRPAISRIIKTLRLSGMVSQVSNKGPVSLGTGAAVVGGAYHLQSRLFMVIKPLLERFVSQTGFSLVLSTVDPLTWQLLYLNGVEDASIEDYSGDWGTLFPVLELRTGRVALGLAETSVQEAILRVAREQYTEPEMEEYLKLSAMETADYSKRGYTQSRGEIYKTLAGISVFMDIPELPNTCLTCVGISSLLTEEKVENEIGDRVISLANKIELLAKQSAAI